MGGRSTAMPERSGGPAEAIVVSVDLIEPNPWNPNVMDEAMFQKELASIRRYGFVDPLTVRQIDGGIYQIIDGENRWKAGKQLGYTELPCWLIVADDATAQELTVILNETRGRPDREKLRDVLNDLISRRGENAVREIMPFDRERFDEIIGKIRVDWNSLEERRQAAQAAGRWKELVFRVPYDAAQVIEEALDQVKDREGFDDEWRALEMICKDAVA